MAKQEEGEENIFQERTSRLLRGLHLSMSQQAEKSYSGKSDDEGVQVKINGRHEVETILLDGKKYGLSEENRQQLQEALAEAISAAVEKSQAGAARTINRALRPEN